MLGTFFPHVLQNVVGECLHQLDMHPVYESCLLTFAMKGKKSTSTVRAKTEIPELCNNFKINKVFQNDIANRACKRELVHKETSIDRYQKVERRLP